MGIVDRIKILCDSHQTTFAELERKIGISNGQIRRWDNASPKTENIQKVADYFDVSVDYLLGRTENAFNKTKKDLYDLEEMLNSNVNMAFGGENLTDAEKQRVKDILTGLFWEERENKK